MAKLPVLLGNLDVTIDSVAPDVASKPSEYSQSLFIIFKRFNLNPLTPLASCPQIVSLPPTFL